MMIFVKPGQAVEVRFIKEGDVEDFSTMKLYDDHVYVKHIAGLTGSVMDVSVDGKRIFNRDIK